MREDTNAKVFKQFLAGAFIATLASIAGWILSPIESRYLTSLTTSGTAIGFTYALGTISIAVLSLFLGRLTDRRRSISRKKIILFGLASGILYPLLYASVINIFQYMGLRLVWAFASVATGPILAAYLQNLMKGSARTGHYFGIMYSAMSLSGAFGHFLGGFLADRYGITAPYIAMAAIFGITFLITLTFFSSHETENSASQNENVPETGIEGVAEKEKHPIFFGVQYVFRKPELVYYFLLNAGYSMNYGIKLMLWPLIILGYTESAAVMGNIFATTGVVAFLILLFAGKAVDRLGVSAGMNSAFFFLILGGFTMAFSENVPMFWLGAALFAVGEAVYGPAQAILLTDYVENKHRGEILGIDNIFDRGFTAIAMFASGVLLSIFSPQNVWLVFMILLLAFYTGAMIFKNTRVQFTHTPAGFSD